MLVYHQVGRGMSQVPAGCIPYLLAHHIVRGMSYEIRRLYARVRRDGRLAFSAVIQSHDSVGARRVVLTPVRLARLCGWVLPLRASTPLWMVADYLQDIEPGIIDTDMHRLMMWMHQNAN